MENNIKEKCQMKRRRLFLLLIILSVGIIAPKNTHATEKETEVGLQFISLKEAPKPITPPKDQLPSTGGGRNDKAQWSLTTDNRDPMKTLPKTGEVIKTFTGTIGAFLAGISFLLLLLRKKKEVDDYER